MISQGKGRLFGIITLVVLFHLGLFYYLADEKPLPKREYMPPPNFSVQQAQLSDPQTGEKLVYKEFTVSTEFAATGPAPTPTPNPKLVQ